MDSCHLHCFSNPCSPVVLRPLPWLISQMHFGISLSLSPRVLSAAYKSSLCRRCTVHKRGPWAFPPPPPSTQRGFVGLRSNRATFEKNSRLTVTSRIDDTDDPITEPSLLVTRQEQLLQLNSIQDCPLLLEIGFNFSRKNVAGGQKDKNAPPIINPPSAQTFERRECLSASRVWRDADSSTWVRHARAG